MDPEKLADEIEQLGFVELDKETFPAGDGPKVDVIVAALRSFAALQLPKGQLIDVLRNGVGEDPTTAECRRANAAMRTAADLLDNG